MSDAQEVARQLVHQAITLLDINRPNDALAAAEEAVAASPEMIEAWCTVTRCHLGLGRLDLARRTIARALSLQPDHAWAVRLQALTYAGTEGGGRVALEAAQRAVTLTPNDPAAHLTRATVERRIGRFPEARESARRAIELDPASPSGYGLAGLIEMDAGHLRRARRMLRAQLARDPGDWTAHNNLGVISTRRLNDINAIRHFARSIRVQPGQTPIENLEGTVCRAMQHSMTLMGLTMAVLCLVALEHDHSALVAATAATSVVASSVAVLTRLPDVIRTAVRLQFVAALARSGLFPSLITGVTVHAIGRVRRAGEVAAAVVGTILLAVPVLAAITSWAPLAALSVAALLSFFLHLYPLLAGAVIRVAGHGAR